MAADTKKPAEDAAAPADAAEAPNTTAGKDAKKAPSKSVDGKPVMHVRVSSPFKVFFDDDAVSLSGANATGPFDILPRHHNFISLLSESELAVARPNGDVVRVRISGGVMHVRADEVIVFLDV